MKQRICLAWFGDFDVPRGTRSKTKKTAPAPAATAVKDPPKVKDAGEIRRMLGRD
jgi:hypothetical protein